MVSQLFDDAIVSATELKKNQRVWFEKAYKTPVSITHSKGRNFVLINRELMGTIYKTKEISEQLIKYCYEIKREDETGKFNSEVFPWAKNLSNEERRLFSEELMKSFVQLNGSNGLDLLEKVITEWQATAEALTNSQFMDVINSESARDYTEID